MHSKSRKIKLSFVQVWNASITSLPSIILLNEDTPCSNPLLWYFLTLKLHFSQSIGVLCQRLLQKGWPYKYISILQPLYSNSRCRIKACGKLSNAFTTINGVRHVNFFITTWFLLCLSKPCKWNIFQVLRCYMEATDWPEWADDVVLPSDDAAKSQP